MDSRYAVEVTVCPARDLTILDWRHGDLRPHLVLWVDDGAKYSSRIDLGSGAETLAWDEQLAVPVPPASRIEDAVLHVDVVRSGAGAGEEAAIPLIGSASLPLRDVVDDKGIGGRVSRMLRLKCPAGRPQGDLAVRIAVREAGRHGYGFALSPSLAMSPGLPMSPCPSPYGRNLYGFPGTPAAAPVYLVDVPKKQTGPKESISNLVSPGHQKKVFFS